MRSILITMEGDYVCKTPGEVLDNDIMYLSEHNMLLKTDEVTLYRIDNIQELFVLTYGRYTVKPEIKVPCVLVEHNITKKMHLVRAEDLLNCLTHLRK